MHPNNKVLQFPSVFAFEYKKNFYSAYEGLQKTYLKS